jgi:hypothetical protein
MKQGFLRSEAFELGEPGQLNMRELTFVFADLVELFAMVSSVRN